jgi:hypothetical protein
MGRGFGANEVKRASQTTAISVLFACKWYASAACSLRRQDPVGREGGSMFERSHFRAITSIYGRL